MNTAEFDVICFGRNSIDLYSQEPGKEFEEITGFHAFVGGSPLNIAVGCRRLGLRSSLLSAVGKDKVGDFVLNFLRKENVDASNTAVIPGTRTPAVILGIEPPDKFPLVYYRDNASDSQISIDQVMKAKIDKCRILQMSGTALNMEPSRSAAFFAAEIARKNNIPVLLDLDFRADQWHDVRAFGVVVRAFFQYVNIVVGTREEILAACLTDPAKIKISHQQISSPEIEGNIQDAVISIIESGTEALIVKTGSHGSSFYLPGRNEEQVPGFPVEVLNILGAGDAYAAGFIYGYLKGWDWYKCCRMGNACGAFLVTKPGCANFNPYEAEILEFIEVRGGF
jgi:5-dehydro-2-deoxygluconokinase